MADDGRFGESKNILLFKQSLAELMKITSISAKVLRNWKFVYPPPSILKVPPKWAAVTKSLQDANSVKGPDTLFNFFCNMS